MAVLELLKAGRVHLTDDDTELVFAGREKKESGKLKSGFLSDESDRNEAET